MRTFILISTQVLFVLFSSCYANNVFFDSELNIDSCDNIILRNGEEISSKVIEVGVTEIKYRKCSKTNGPIYSVLKSSVFMIQYSNGKKEIISEEKERELPVRQQKDFALTEVKLLFTNGVEKAGYLLYKDNNWVYYGAKPKKFFNEEGITVFESAYQKKLEEIEANTKMDAIDKAAAREFARRDVVRKKAKVKYKVLVRKSTDNVFSITHADGKEEIIYSPDTLGFLVTDVVEPEVDYTVEEMRRYIYGAQDGKKVKKAAALWTSAGISTIGSGLGAFYGPIAPATYILVLGTTRQKPNERLVSHPEYIQDEAYLAGYSKAARKRKIIAAAEGGLIGLAIGIPIYWAAFRGF